MRNDIAVRWKHSMVVLLGTHAMVYYRFEGLGLVKLVCGLRHVMVAA